MTVPEQRKARKPVWRWLKSALGIAALLWFGWYAYVRITTPASRGAMDQSWLTEQFGTPAAGDRSADWLATAQDIWGLPVLGSPPPGYEYADESGTRYTATTPIDISVVNCGPWAPEIRPGLRVYIAYFSEPDTACALDELRDMGGAPLLFDPMITGSMVSGATAAIPYSTFRQAMKTLVARARYQADERGDLLAAWRDLESVLAYSRNKQPQPLIGWLVGMAVRSLAADELGKIIREHELPPALAAEMSRGLIPYCDIEEDWSKTMAGERIYLQDQIDKVYTRDANGDGWLVFSSLQAPMGGMPTVMQCAGTLSNLFSPPYDSRREAEQANEWLFARWAGVAKLPWLRAHAETLNLEVNGLGPTMGPAFEMPMMIERVHVLSLRSSAVVRAARIDVALNQFRRVHGDYPQAIEELVPEFLPELPIEPFCNAPFRYRREGDGYMLYGCGVNGVDDGGRFPPPPAARRQYNEGDGGDDFFTWPRPEGTYDPILKAVSPPDAGAES